MSTKINVRPAAAAAQQEVPDNVITDAIGRSLTINQPDFLTESRIMRALGDAASNQHYVLAYVMPAVMVTHVDGVFVPTPTTNVQIEGAISRLGREGMVAVLTHIEEKAKAAQARAEAAAAVNSEAEALKNS